MIKFLKTNILQGRVVKNAGNYSVRMNDRTRKFLNSLYEPYNRKFTKLTRLDFGWPS